MGCKLGWKVYLGPWQEWFQGAQLEPGFWLGPPCFCCLLAPAALHPMTYFPCLVCNAMQHGTEGTQACLCLACIK